MVTSKYQVSGMTCRHCEMSIQEEVGEVAGVEAVEVEATTGTLIVTANRPLDDGVVLAAVEEAGYKAVRL